MKVLIAIPCLLNGGTERQTLMLSEVLLRTAEQVEIPTESSGESAASPAEASAKVGHTVDVLCYFEADTAIIGEFKKAGVNVRLMNMDRRSGFLHVIQRLKKEIGLIRPDVVHVQYMAPGALPVIAARLAGAGKVFATVHQPYTPSHGRFAKLILRIASLLTTKFIVVSENAEKSWFGSSCLFDENKPMKLQPHHFTIYNAVDADAIRRLVTNTDKKSLKKELNLSDAQVIIGTVSRLRHEKGTDILIEAFSMLTAQNKEICLLVAGTGPDEEILKTRVTESGISSQVIFYGQAPWERAMQLLSIMDIVVVASRFEGFGLTAAEAMAAGKPVIASDTSGLKEVVSDHETGLLFPVGDVTALSDAMAKLVSDPRLRNRLGEAGRERVKSNFSTDIFRKKIHALYRCDW